MSHSIVGVTALQRQTSIWLIMSQILNKKVA